MFNNDLSQLGKLIKYLFQDLKSLDKIHYDKIYGYDPRNLKTSSNFTIYNYGIVFFSINRLSFAVFNDLMCDNRVF